jgi:hypothetical protein
VGLERRVASRRRRDVVLEQRFAGSHRVLCGLEGRVGFRGLCGLRGFCRLNGVSRGVELRRAYHHGGSWGECPKRGRNTLGWQRR